MSPIMAADEPVAAQARFVFKGTVQQQRAANVPMVRDTEHTVVVHVDDVLQAAKELAALRGESVTVQLRPDQAVVEGQQAVFFTNGWLYGKHVAVVAVHLRPVTADDTAEAPSSWETAVGRQLDRDQRERVSGADLVVVGRVGSARAVPVPDDAVVSEHDPVWHEAEVEVHSVEKGRHTDHTVTVRFPKSRDVSWHRAPKFTEGDEGVWLLRAAPGEQAAGAAVFTALHELDFRPKEELDSVRAQIASAP